VVSKGRTGSTVELRFGGRAVSISKAAFDGLQWRVGVGIVSIGGGAVRGVVTLGSEGMTRVAAESKN
jgi:hypothetical protein